MYKRQVLVAREAGNWKDLHRSISDLYGEPPDEVVDYAHKVLASIEVPPPKGPSFGAEELAARLRRDVEKVAPGWRVEVSDDYTARVTVVGILKLLAVKEGAKFTEEEYVKLKVHEVGVHIGRFVNGERQPLEIFKFGFVHYLEAEEGLATYAEERAGVLSPQVLRRYAGRVLASRYTLTMSFHEVYTELRRHFPEHEAYAIAERVKRGVVDTGVPGGYTKDQIYLSGYLKVREISEDDLCLLFVGKVGLEDLPKVRRWVEQGMLTVPDLPKWATGGGR